MSSKSFTSSPTQNLPQINQYMLSLDPYIEYAADIQVDRVKSKIENEGKRVPQSAPRTNRPQPPSSRKFTSATSTITPLELQKNSNKSPRQVKTAPNKECTVSIGSFNSDDKDQRCSSPTFRRQEVNDSSNQHGLSLLHSPHKHGIGNSIIQTGKNSFDRAVESLAALKLHDYALRRKEKMKQRYRLWEEVKGTSRALEINCIEQLLGEMQENLAAWKIKHYVHTYRHRLSEQRFEEERKALSKNVKMLQKRTTTTQAQLDAIIGLQLEIKNENLQSEIDVLKGILAEKEIEKVNYDNLIAAFENKMVDMQTAHVKELASQERKLQDTEKELESCKTANSIVKEELLTSRLACQDCMKHIATLENSLKEMTKECEYLKSLNPYAELDQRQLIGQLESSVADRDKVINSLKEEHKLLQEKISSTQIELDTIGLENLNMKSTCDAVFVKNAALEEICDRNSNQIRSLERLVTEITVQHHEVQAKLEMSQEHANTLMTEIQTLKAIIIQRDEELVKKVEDINDLSNAGFEQKSQIDEIQIKFENAQMNIEDVEEVNRLYVGAFVNLTEYAHMLESQLVASRKGLDGFSSVILSPMASYTDYRLNPIIQKLHHTFDDNSKHRYDQDESQRILSEASKFSPTRSLEDNSNTGLQQLELRLVGLLTMLESKFEIGEHKDQLNTKEGSEINDSVDDGIILLSEKCDDDLSNNEINMGHCESLLHQISSEKEKLDSSKLQLIAIREQINELQEEKKVVSQEIRNWQRREQKKTGIVPKEKGNTPQSKELYIRLHALEQKLNSLIVLAQSIASDAIKFKTRCDELQLHLDNIYFERIASKRDGAIDESVVEEIEQLVRSRNSISIASDEAFANAKIDHNFQPSNAIIEEEEEDLVSESNQLHHEAEGGDSYNSVRLQTPPAEHISSCQDEVHSDLSTFSSSKHGSEIEYFDAQLLSVDELVQDKSSLAQQYEHRLIEKKDVLMRLLTEKHEARALIEKWTLHFLVEIGRVPCLSDTKYGSNNFLFENFNEIQHKISDEHAEIQEIIAVMQSSCPAVFNELTELVSEPIMRLSEGESYEDAYHLHFDTVEEFIAKGTTDVIDDQLNVSIASGSVFSQIGPLDFDKLPHPARMEVMESLDTDLNNLSLDISRLHAELNEEREAAHVMNGKLTQVKLEIKKWSEDFFRVNAKPPTENDIKMTAPELYKTYQELKDGLNEQLEKLRVLALLVTSKVTETERLKVLKRKFSRRTNSNYSESRNSSQSTLSRVLSEDLHENKFFPDNSTLSNSEQDSRSVREYIESDMAKLYDDITFLKTYLKQSEVELNVFRKRKVEIKEALIKIKYNEATGEMPQHPKSVELIKQLLTEQCALDDEISELLENREKSQIVLAKKLRTAERHQSCR